MTYTLPAHQADEVRARANNECQRQLTGCTGGCDLIEPVYTADDLKLMHRDIAAPDNWLCVCANCTQHTTEAS